jgi:enoyl-CoA hydratase
VSVRAHRDGGACVLTVDRPARKNALDPATLAALGDAARDLAGDDSLRAVVLTGAPGAGVFLSGGDLQALVAVRTDDEARAMAGVAHAAVDALRALEVPLVAAVNGDAYGGGCELAAACDYRVCDEGVRFHWVQTRFAVTTGWGGASNLLDLVPRGTALRWLLSGRAVTVDEARAAGFADEVVPAGESVARAVAFAHHIAQQPRGATARMLTLVRESGRLSRDEARELELREFGASWATDDHHRAVAAFLARQR